MDAMSLRAAKAALGRPVNRLHDYGVDRDPHGVDVLSTEFRAVAAGHEHPPGQTPTRQAFDRMHTDAKMIEAGCVGTGHGGVRYVLLPRGVNEPLRKRLLDRSDDMFLEQPGAVLVLVCASSDPRVRFGDLRERVVMALQGVGVVAFHVLRTDGHEGNPDYGVSRTIMKRV